jgi:hypothetical protein
LTVQPLLQVWKALYCEANYERCARYKKACSGDAVPITLLPNGANLGQTGT